MASQLTVNTYQYFRLIVTINTYVSDLNTYHFCTWIAEQPTSPCGRQCDRGQMHWTTTLNNRLAARMCTLPWVRSTSTTFKGLN